MDQLLSRLQQALALPALPVRKPTALQLLAGVGLVTCLTTLREAASLLWLHSRPSSLPRYLVTRDGRPAWALVTGATGPGLGSALADQLARAGFNLVLHCYDQAKLDQLRARLEKAYPDRQFRTICIDARSALNARDTTSDDWLAPLHDINLTVLVNSAGGVTTPTKGRLEVLPANRLLDDFAFNLVFPTLLIRAAMPLLTRSGRGLILNVGSLSDNGVPLIGAYPASKGGMATLGIMLNNESVIAGRDIETLHVRLGAMYNPQQDLHAAPTFSAPRSETVAAAILAKVGCGRHSVIPYLGHALLLLLATRLPGVSLDKANIKHMVAIKMPEEPEPASAK